MINRCIFLLFIFTHQIITNNTMPRVSIITSVYAGDEFIEGFMHDITQQTIFGQCELIMINANSPGSEEKVIRKYMAQYPNIRYKKLEKDPGLYGVWNIAIQMARAPYITNANLDDRLKFDCYAVHEKALDKHPEIDLVYSGYFTTNYPNETFEHNRHKRATSPKEFSIQNMRRCLPNNHPMWRKSMHEKYGYFDAWYTSAGDKDMWLRAVSQGSIFMKVPGIYALRYHNPKGLSTDPAKKKIRVMEQRIILRKYGYLWNITPESKKMNKRELRKVIISTYLWRNHYYPKKRNI